MMPRRPTAAGPEAVDRPGHHEPRRTYTTHVTSFLRSGTTARGAVPRRSSGASFKKCGIERHPATPV